MSKMRTPEVIRADEAYTIAEFRLRTGIGDFVWRSLRKELPVRAIGKKHFVLGADWLVYLKGIEPSN